jgi:peptidyl-dipeptidase Dcp
VWEPALEMAKKETAMFQAMIDAEGGKFKLQPWDWAYYAEKVRKQKYELDEETLSQYFVLENVRSGIFDVAKKLYGLNFTEKTDVPTYHPDVNVFEVTDADGSYLGILYMDWFPRESKRAGAWMSEYRGQYIQDGKEVRPVVTTNFNFTKPTANTPALLTMDEVLTGFHEFGHALHGLLSKCTFGSLSGTAVSRDFVELPSQIMENWAMEPEVLKSYARHYKTGEVIPDELIEKIEASRHFNQGFTTVEYLAASFLDLDYHTLAVDEIEINVPEFQKKSLDAIGLIPQIVSRYQSTYFSHIFSGGYSAGYYAYIWAEILDADAFNAFVEKGNIFDPETAKSFRTNILEKGGTREPMDLYLSFRGKEPGIDPLLKKRGLK